jgi:autotransporter-associated beta strand protein
MLIRRALPTVVIFLAVLALVSTANAATYTWSGPATGDIDIAANWGGVVPSPTGDTAFWNEAVAGPLTLSYSSNAFAGSPGNAGVFLSLGASQTDSVGLDSGTNTSAFRLGGITTAAGAGAFTLGVSGEANTFNITLGGAAGTQTFTNNSSNTMTVNSDVVFGLGGGGAHTLALAGSGNFNFYNNFTNGSGTLNLSQAGQVGTGVTALAGTNTLGSVSVSSGTVSISGPLTISNNNGGGSTTPFGLGLGSGSVGVVNVLAGANITDTGGNGWNIGLGEAAGGYGEMDISGGSILTHEFEVGNNGYGLYNQTGGTVSITANGWFLPGRNGSGANNGAFGVANFSGGQFIGTASGMNMEFGLYTGGTGYSKGGDINVSGTALVSLGVNNLRVGVNTSGGRGVVNLSGGTVSTNGVALDSAGAGSLNFNGGTLAPTAANATFIASNVPAYVYSSGGTINNSGYNITIPAALLAPTGSGVTTITLNGSGYTSPPLVYISGGAGSYAAGLANIDSSGGIASVTITNPGIGYTSTPTVTLYGGGGSLSSQAVAIAANTSGGLTFTGSATTTLSAANTYTGTTTVNGGTAALSYASGGVGTLRGPLTINPGGYVNLTVGDAIGYASGVCIPTINVNGGVINNGYSGNNSYITNWTLTGGTATSSGGGSYNFSTNYGVTTYASTATSLISAGIVVRDANNMAFNVAQGTTASGVDLNVSGAITGGTAGITKSGAGTMLLSGANTYTGPTTVGAGVLQITGSIVPASGALGQMLLGNASGSVAAVYQSGNSLVTTTNGGGGSSNAVGLGNTAGAYGDYNLSGGTLNVAGEIDTGSANGGAGTIGRLDISGGIINLPNAGGTYFLCNRNGAGESAIVNISGGAVQITNGGTPADGAFNGLAANWNNSGTSTTYVTLSGTGQFLTPSLNVKLNEGSSYNGVSGSSTNTAVLNLNGGTLQALGFYTADGSTTTGINFNGGTLKAGNASNASFIANNLGFIYVNSGGATIDDNGQGITIAQPVLAPGGSGVSSISLSASGSGYIAPPVVTISGGGGTGATAVANINPLTGALTGITITNPGVGYTSVPGVTLSGGSGAGASVGTIATTANVSGGLTKVGTGTLTLSSSNTYSGATTISSGTLALGSAGSINQSSSIYVAGAATFNTSAVSGGFSLASGQTLGGSGAVNGSVAVGSGTLTGFLTMNGNVGLGSGGTIVPGTISGGSASGGVISGGTATIGTLTLNNLTLSGGTLDFALTSPGSPGVGSSLLNLSAGSLSASGVTSIAIDPLAGFVPGRYTIIDFGNTNGTTANFSLPSTVNGLRIKYSVAAGALNLDAINVTGPIWNIATGGNWSTGTNWSSGTAPNGAGQTANFFQALSSSGTVSLNVPVTVGTLNFDNPTARYTVGGPNVLTLDNSGATALVNVLSNTHAITANVVLNGPTAVTTTDTAEQLNVGGNVGGAGTLTMQGPGMLVLSGSNSFAGAALSGGSLQLVGGTALPAAPLAVSGGVLDLGGVQQTAGGVAISGGLVQDGKLNGSSFTLSGGSVTGALTGSGSARVTGGGTVCLSGTNTFSGGLTANSGVLNINADAALGAAGGSLTFTGNATLQAGAGGITVSSVRPFTINSGVTATIDTQGYGMSILSTVAGMGGLTKIGSGTLTLSSANTYAGATTVNAGTLVAANTQALGTNASAAAVTLAGGALDLATDASINPYNVTLTGNATILSDQATPASAGITHTLGGLAIGDNTLTIGSGPNVTGANAAITFGGVAPTSTAGGTINTAITTNLGPISGGGALTIGGAGNTFITSGGSLYGLNANGPGAVTISGGSLAATSINNVGNVAGTSAVLQITGGSLGQYELYAGMVNGGVGAIYQSGGAVTTNYVGGDAVGLGQVNGGYGYYSLSGGLLTTQELQVATWGPGFNNNGGSGLFEMSGGTLDNLGWITMTRSGATLAQTGVLNISGGLIIYAGGGLAANWGAGETAIINVSGGTITTAANEPIALNFNNNSTNKGILNLNGGVVQPSGVTGGSATVNFNGGTLKASGANTNFISVGNAYVYGNGGTIDNAGNNITILESLYAPSGSGATATGASITGGSGYVAPPIVTLSGGGGTGATAIASVTGGSISGVAITNPGVGYTSAPTVNLSGGGGSGASITLTGLVANTSGGMTFQGSGITTLAVSNYYGGPTAVNAGTLLVTQTTSLPNWSVSGSVSVAPAATLAVEAGGPATDWTAANIGTLLGTNAFAPGSFFGISVPAAGNSFTYAADIGANQVNIGFTKLGPGLLILASTNSYTGVTTISAGTLQIDNGGTTATLGTGNVVDNATLLFARADNPTVGNAISGAGAVYQAGGGTLTLAGNNGNSGAMAVASGALVLSGSNSGLGPIAAVNGAITINGATSTGTAGTVTAGPTAGYIGTLNLAGGLLNANATAAPSLQVGAASGAAGIFNMTGGTLNTASELWLSTASGAAGTMNMSGGVANIGSWLAVGRGGNNGVLNMSGGSLTVQSASLTLASFAGNVGALNLSGGTLNAVNSIWVGESGTGAMTVSGSGLAISNAAMAVALNAGSSGTLGLDGGMVVAPGITSGGTSTVYFNGGTLRASSPSTNFLNVTSAIVQAGGAVLDTNGNNVTVNAVLTHDPNLGADDGGLTKLGAGVLTLSRSNTYTGPTLISGGTLQLSSAGLAASAAPVAVYNFAQTPAGSTTVTNLGTGGSAMNGTLAGGASIVSGGLNGQNALELFGNSNSFVGVNNAITSLSTTGASWTVTGWVNTSTTGATLFYKGNGSWASGNSTFYLTNGNGNSGGTAAGFVRYGGGWVWGSSPVNTGTWQFVAITDNNGTETIYTNGVANSTNLNLGGTLADSGGTVSIGYSHDTGDGDVPFNGLMSSMSFYNAALSAADVNALYNGGNVLPATSPVQIAGGATLDLGGVSQTVASLADAGGSGTVTSSAVGNVTMTLAPASGSTTFSGSIQNGAGALALVKVGSGTQVLAGSSSYSGGTTLNGGMLVAANGNNGSALGSGTLTLNGGTLAAGPAGGSIGGPLQSGGLGAYTIAPGAALSSGFGTLNLNGGLTADSYTTLLFNLGAPLAGGTYSGDLINLNGSTLTFNGCNILFGVNPTTAGDYRLFANLGGNSSVTTGYSLPTAPNGETYALSTGVDSGYLDLVVSGAFSGGAWSWNSSTSGSWTAGSNWSPATVPSGGTVTFAGANAAPITVTLDANQTAGALVFGDGVNASSYTISSGTVNTAATLTLGTPAGGSISVLSGMHNISAPIVLAGSLAVSASAGGSLELSGSVSDGGAGYGLSLSGNGELVLSGTGSYSGGTAVSGGTLDVTSPTALADGSNLTVGTDASAFLASAAPLADRDHDYMVPGAIAAVPEPGTLVLVLAAGTALALVDRRRRRQWA